MFCESHCRQVSNLINATWLGSCKACLSFCHTSQLQGSFCNVLQPCGNGSSRDLPLANVKLTYKVLMCYCWPCIVYDLQAHVFSLLTASHAAVRAVMLLHAASMLMSLPMISSFSRLRKQPHALHEQLLHFVRTLHAHRLLWILLHMWCFLLMLARTRTGHRGICALALTACCSRCGRLPRRELLCRCGRCRDILLVPQKHVTASRKRAPGPGCAPELYCTCKILPAFARCFCENAYRSTHGADAEVLYLSCRDLFWPPHSYASGS